MFFLVLLSCAVEPLPLFLGAEGVLYEAGRAVTHDTAADEDTGQEEDNDTAAEESTEMGSEETGVTASPEEDTSTP
jgi:hypothetical protein